MERRGQRSGGAGGTVMATSARLAAWVSPSEPHWSWRRSRCRGHSNAQKWRGHGPTARLGLAVTLAKDAQPSQTVKGIRGGGAFPAGHFSRIATARRSSGSASR